MASPFERAFNPAFQQASAVVMKELADERQDKRFQQRMLEQRQYDARLLADRQAHEAELLKGSRVYEQGQTDAANKVIFDRQEKVDFDSLIRDGLTAGMDPQLFSGMGPQQNQTIRDMVGRWKQASDVGRELAESGTFAPFRYGTENTAEAIGYRKAADKKMGGLRDEADKKLAILEATNQASLEDAQAKFAAITGQPIPENATKAQLDEGVVAYNKNRTEGEDYFNAIAVLEAAQGKPLQGLINKVNPTTLELERGSLPAGQRQQVGEPIETLKRMTFDLGEQRRIDAEKKVAEARESFTNIADATKYLRDHLVNLSASDKKRVYASGGDVLTQATFLRANLNRTAAYAVEDKASGKPVHFPETFYLTPEKMPTGVTEANPTPAKLPPVKVQPPPLPSPSLDAKLETGGIGPEARKVLEAHLGSNINIVKDPRAEGIKFIGEQIKTLEKSIVLDKEGLESLLKRTEIKISPGQMGGGGGTVSQMQKSGAFFEYGDDENKALSKLSAREFDVYKMERSRHAIDANRIRQRIQSKEQSITQLKTDLGVIQVIQYRSPALPPASIMQQLTPPTAVIKELATPPAILQKLTETPRDFLDSTPAELQEMFNKDPARLGRELRAAGIGEDLERMLNKLKRLGIRKYLTPPNSNGFQKLPKLPDPSKIP